MKLAHVLLMTARGVPTVYYGDEQGFTGDGNDQDAREDMFASRVASYNDNRLVGSAATTATDNFDPAHPLYTLIAELSAIRKAHARLREGRTVLRHYGPKPGLLAFTRGEDDGEEILVAVNTSDQPVSMNVEVGYRSRAFIGLAGACPTTASAPGSVAISLPAFGYAVCRATPID
jgi:glycosidase